jgi:hypothetical protein
MPATGGSGSTTPPTGWSVIGTSGRGQSYEITGEAASQGFALTASQTDTGALNDVVLNARSIVGSTTVAASKLYRIGAKMRISNAAGTGPAVGIKTAGIKFIRSSTIIESAISFDYQDWQIIQSVDGTQSTSTGNAIMQLETTCETDGGTVDYLVEFEDFDVWEITP